MVMQADPIFRCYEAVKERSNSKPYVIYLSPQGTPLKQKKCLSLAQHQHLLLLCGHYEGVDERVLEEIVDEEISIGDYVLTGGELAALVLVDSVVRLCEGVLASPECFEEESHYNGLLEYPQYTRPEIWHEKRVPEILLSGHHANINRWRREKELERTLCKRPDMLAQCELSEADRKYLDTFQKQIPSDDQTEE